MTLPPPAAPALACGPLPGACWPPAAPTSTTRAPRTCRVIRHAGDHAAIVLADARYLQGAGNNNPGAAATSVPGAAGAPALGGLLGQLPGWIQASVDTRGSHYGHVHGRLHAFFKGHCRS